MVAPSGLAWQLRTFGVCVVLLTIGRLQAASASTYSLRVLGVLAALVVVVILVGHDEERTLGWM